MIIKSSLVSQWTQNRLLREKETHLYSQSPVGKNGEKERQIIIFYVSWIWRKREKAKIEFEFHHSRSVFRLNNDDHFVIRFFFFSVEIENEEEKEKKEEEIESTSARAWSSILDYLACCPHRYIHITSTGNHHHRFSTSVQCRLSTVDTKRNDPLVFCYYFYLGQVKKKERTSAWDT
jgi:hypothetical protein